ncbi:hypothetical protein IWW55_002196, partial [Coemansia sp. RSA 2706]
RQAVDKPDPVRRRVLRGPDHGRDGADGAHKVHAAGCVRRRIGRRVQGPGRRGNGHNPRRRHHQPVQGHLRNAAARRARQRRVLWRIRDYQAIAHQPERRPGLNLASGNCHCWRSGRHGQLGSGHPAGRAQVAAADGARRQVLGRAPGLCRDDAHRGCRRPVPRHGPGAAARVPGQCGLLPRRGAVAAVYEQTLV